MLRYLRLLLEFSAGVMAVLLILTLLALWRLHETPFTTTALTPNIEALLNHRFPGTQAHIAQSRLEWNNVTRTFALHIDELNVLDSEGHKAAGLVSMDMAATLTDLLTGQFIPRSLMAHQGFIRLVRTPQGEFYFGAPNPSSPRQEQVTEVNFKKKIDRLLSRLPRADIANKIAIDGLAIELDDQAAKPLVTATVSDVTIENAPEGLTGGAKLQLRQNDAASAVTLHYEYKRDDRTQGLSADLDGLNPALYAPLFLPETDAAVAKAIDMPLTGNLQLTLNKKLDLQTATITLAGGGSLDYPPYWPAPRTVKTLTINAQYEGDKRQLSGSVALDLDGPKAGVTFTGIPAPPPLNGMDMTLNLTLADWPMDQYSQIWPRPILPDVYNWISKNLAKGRFDHGEATFKGRLPLDHPDDFDLTEGSGTVSASDAQVSYLDGLPPAKNVDATADFDLRQVTIHIASGAVANIKIQPFAIKMTDLEKDIQQIDIPLNVSGNISDILALLDLPPLNYMKDVGMKPTDIQGTASAVVDLKFPLLDTLEMKDVEINGKGSLANASALNIAPGLEFTKGFLDLGLDKEGIALNGPLVINNLPFQVAYKHYFNRREGRPLRSGKLTSILTDAQWMHFAPDFFKGSHGAITLDLQFTQPSKELFKLDGAADLTRADIAVDSLNWKKPVGAAGELKASIDIPKNKPVNIKSLDLRSLNAHIAGTALLDTVDGKIQLETADLPAFVIGRSNLGVTIAQDEDDSNKLIFTGAGPALDIAGLMKQNENAEPAAPRPMEFHLKADRLYTGNDNYIGNAEGYAIRDLRGWSAIDLHGLAQGNHALAIQLLPQEDKRSFSLTCDDFGEMLKSMGITDNITGGSIDVHGASTAADPYAIEGKAKIGKFVVTDLPLLAVLINAASPFGFTDILTRSATFDRLTSRFRWNGNILELNKLNASGNSVGINMNGRINLDSGKVDLRGTLVPFSIVNRVIGAIPWIGNIMTGGSGQGVLAVSYTVKGTLANPNISANPISLLTPGFVRNLFFGNDEDSDKDILKPVEPAAAPPAVPQPLSAP